MTQPHRFLVIDDDPGNNFVCQLLIKKAIKTAEVQTFTDPLKGLDYIRNEYPKKEDPARTVLFLDLNMPLMTGWEVLDEFNKFPDSLKNQFTVCILSSSIDPRDKERAADYQCVSKFFEKPIDLEHIKIFATKG